MEQLIMRRQNLDNLPPIPELPPAITTLLLLNVVILYFFYKAPADNGVHCCPDHARD